MINDQLVLSMMQPPDGWVDTPEQAKLRDCLTSILLGHSTFDTMMMSNDLIIMMRDQLLTAVANVRRTAAKTARRVDKMRPQQIANATGLSLATVSRLLTEGPRYVRPAEPTDAS